MNERDLVTLLRKDDPLHEHRQIILYANSVVSPSWTVWQATGFLSEPVPFSRREQLYQGGENDARAFFESTKHRLIQDGFIECIPDVVRAFLAKK